MQWQDSATSHTFNLICSSPLGTCLNQGQRGLATVQELPGSRDIPVSMQTWYITLAFSSLGPGSTFHYFLVLTHLQGTQDLNCRCLLGTEQHKRLQHFHPLKCLLDERVFCSDWYIQQTEGGKPKGEQCISTWQAEILKNWEQSE